MHIKRISNLQYAIPPHFSGAPAHAHVMCTRPFLLLLLKGLGTRLGVSWPSLSSPHSLASNSIGDEGAKALSGSLKTMKNLQMLV